MSGHTIAVDTRWVESRSAGAGTKSYIEGLLGALLRLDTTNRYHLWGASVPQTSRNAHHDAFGGQYRRAWQLAWKTFGWPPLDWVGPNADLWHFTNYVAPPTKTRFVVTIHDLAYLDYPQYVEPKNLAYLQRFVPETLERAEQVIAVSEATKESLKEKLKVPESRLTVTPEACDPVYYESVPEDQIRLIKDKYGVDGDYFLAVGTLEPRKNLKNLLLAFAGIRRHTKEQLVIVGGQGWLFDETKELLQKLGLGDRVIFTGYAPKQELPALYQGAKLFVFPSVYEGFGIPVLEAMASGTPVICSNTSSLPEVGGMAALYFDPQDTEALKLALRRGLEDAVLRERLAEAGREQARQFSWEETARLTLETYRRVLGTDTMAGQPA